MAKFVYNNTKNTNIGYILFELNYRYHAKVFFEDETDSCLRSYSTDKLVKELRELIEICC